MIQRSPINYFDYFLTFSFDSRFFVAIEIMSYSVQNWPRSNANL